MRSHGEDAGLREYGATKRARISLLFSYNQADEWDPVSLATAPARIDSSLTYSSASTSPSSQLVMPHDPCAVFQRSVSTFLACNGLSFSTVSSPLYRQMMILAGTHIPITLTPASVKTDTLAQSDAIKQVIIDRLQGAHKYVTSAVDGWTNVRSDKVNNVVLLAGGTAYYWMSIVNADDIDSGIWIFNKLDPVIQELQQLGI